jgi:glycosyltransferase involved in cell wall biosynthesis
MEIHYDLTIIVPVYNEEENLSRLEKELSAFLNQSKTKAKVLFVNDGSTDNSTSLIESICFENESFNFIHLKENKGLSTALKAGIDQIVTKYTGYIDADLQTSPSDFDKLMEFADQFDLVSGVRVNRKDSLLKKKSSSIANSVRRSVTRDGVTDTGCPLKIIRTEAAKRIPFFDGMHRFLAALVQLDGGTVKEVPVNHYQRLAGKSKYHLFNRLFGTLIDLWAFCWMKRNYIRYEIISKG